MPTIQMTFVLDCTGSMGSWIEAAKTQIREVITNTQAKHGTGAEFEIALVRYWDYDEDCRVEPQVTPFTKDVSAIEAVLKETRVNANTDTCEDIAGALEATLGLAWRDDAIRHIVHITDAPPHGVKYHEPWYSDRYPHGDPRGLNPETAASELSKKEIHYTFFRINESTDMFVDLLAKEFGDRFHDVEFPREHKLRRVGDLDDITFARLRNQTTFSPAVTQIIDYSMSIGDPN